MWDSITGSRSSLLEFRWNYNSSILTLLLFLLHFFILLQMPSRRWRLIIELNLLLLLIKHRMFPLMKVQHLLRLLLLLLLFISYNLISRRINPLMRLYSLLR